jgi:hypothetical protein
MGDYYEELMDRTEWNGRSGMRRDGIGRNEVICIVWSMVEV